YPAAVCDVKTAIRFLYANAEKYGYDREKIAVWGESAGAYLATMSALSGKNEYADLPFIGEENAPSVTPKISVLVDFYGIIDFDKAQGDFDAQGVPRWLQNAVGGHDYINAFLGRELNELTKEEYAELSPTTRVTPALAETGLKVFVAHGTADVIVPITQSTRLAATFEKALGEKSVVFTQLKNARHADDEFYLPEKLEKVRDFLDQSFQKGGK
ncbi:MAG: alpha/beta hydrolase, partial [Clostridia bacterium]|nr:alpha/beta hydrolase [Clostridia bacterium]